MKRAAGIILRAGDRYLLLRRAKGNSQAGMLGTPGGAIDDGETPAEAAARETAEETGELLDPMMLIKVSKIEHKFSEDDHVEWHTYFAVVNEFEPKIQAREHSEYLWLSYAEIAERDDVIDTLTEIIEEVEQL